MKKPMNINTQDPAAQISSSPTLEDAVRAGDARRKLADRLEKARATTMTFQGKARTETVSLPPMAIMALHQILACISAGRGVRVVAEDSEIEIDDAALLAGHDPLEFLEALTQLGLPLRSEAGRVLISTEVLGACLDVIHGDQPEPTLPGKAPGKAPGNAPGWARAHDILRWRQWHFAERLAYDLKKAGNRSAPETYPIDYYFGSRPLLGVRPPSWPALKSGR
jgi:hypothetical protein